MTTPAEQIEEKNRQHTTGAWLWLAAVTLPDASVFRIVRNSADITVGGYLYRSVYFRLRGLRESSDGALPRVTLSVANAARPLQGHLADIEGCSVVLSRVNSKLLASDYSERQRTYRVAAFNEDSEYYNFTLGPPNILMRRFPLRTLTAPECDNVFGDLECGYSGSETVCNGSVTDCLARSNIVNFNGELGMQDRARIIV
jgi:phage-related protein